MSYVRYNHANIEVIGENDNKGFVDFAKSDEIDCKADAKVSKVDVKTLETENCVNTPVAISAFGRGAVADVPVVLAQLTVQANVNSVIQLPEFAFEIKQIKKRLKITQCLLLQDTNILFIKGFIRKNIDFSTREHSNAEGFSGDIKHVTVDIPFSCTTPVTFNGVAPINPTPSTTTEFVYRKREDIHHPDFSEKDHLLSSDLREHNQISTEFFNELPFCELVSARIIEFDEQLMPEAPKEKGYVMPFEEKRFKRIEEKMVVFITLRLLQKRLVAVPAVAGVSDECPKEE